MEEYMKELEDFFDADLQIKKLLMDCSPSEMDSFDQDSKVTYFNRLYRAFGIINQKLERFVGGAFFRDNTFKDYSFRYHEEGPADIEYIESEVPDAFKEKMGEIRTQLLKKEAAGGNLLDVYNSVFAKMDHELIKCVKEKIKGCNQDPQKTVAALIRDSSSINEILHVFHAHVSNSMEILQALPEISKKAHPDNSESQALLLGVANNSLAREIFDAFRLNPDHGTTCIAGLKDRTLIMARDVGHALTMSIQEEGDKQSVRVEYFIPIVLDADIVSALPAAEQTLDYETGTASGIITIPREDAASRVCSFIEQVPDDDIEFQQNLLDYSANPEMSLMLVYSGEISPRNLLLELYRSGIQPTNDFKNKLLKMPSGSQRTTEDVEASRT